jgi:hypothetical protein
MKYSNIPPEAEPFDNSTLKAFDNYRNQPIELDTAVFNAMKGFFTNRGFGDVAAESITTTFIIQSKNDGYNPMQILDVLKGLKSVELSGLVAEILNYNRYKSSSLGYAQKFIPNQEIQRNIIDIGGVVTVISKTLTNEYGIALTDETGQKLTTE